MGCIVCGSSETVSIFKPEPQPLVALNIPNTYGEAINAPRFEMDWHLCLKCSHVFNSKFDYANIPYNNDPNLMYNGGVAWNKIIDQEIDKHKDILSTGTVIDVGCGAGEFLEAILSKLGNNNLIGFEPGPDADIVHPFAVLKTYFGSLDTHLFKPDTIICRNVLEHLADPHKFLSDISFNCGANLLDTQFLLEVPCFNTALREGRITDFLYEHNSNFTKKSLHTLLIGSDLINQRVYTVYNGEVLIGTANVCPCVKESIPPTPKSKWLVDQAKVFKIKASRSLELIPDQISKLSMPVVWGGTGKGAAFLNYYKPRVGYVVDSDIRKQGKFVPGTGQFITAPKFMEGYNSWSIIIPSYWRVPDILNEIKQLDLKYKKILTVKDGELVDVTQS